MVGGGGEPGEGGKRKVIPGGMAQDVLEEEGAAEGVEKGVMTGAIR
jgi:hypothetical protein